VNVLKVVDQPEESDGNYEDNRSGSWQNGRDSN
jgi:hypothetical protein